jgi:hypothetical protein
MTDFLNDWGLTLVTFIPAVGAVLVMAMPKGDDLLVKVSPWRPRSRPG